MQQSHYLLAGKAVSKMFPSDSAFLSREKKFKMVLCRGVQMFEIVGMMYSKDKL